MRFLNSIACLVLLAVAFATAEQLPRISLKRRQLDEKDAQKLHGLRYGLKNDLKGEASVRLLNYLDAQVILAPRHGSRHV